MPQVKVNFGAKLNSTKKTFPPEKKPVSTGAKGKVNPFLKNDAAKKAAPAPAAPKEEPKPAPVPAAPKEEPKAAPAPQQVKVQVGGNKEVKVEVAAPKKPAGSKSFSCSY